MLLGFYVCRRFVVVLKGTVFRLVAYAARTRRSRTEKRSILAGCHLICSRLPNCCSVPVFEAVLRELSRLHVPMDSTARTTQKPEAIIHVELCFRGWYGSGQGPQPRGRFLTSPYNLPSLLLELAHFLIVRFCLSSLVH